MTEPPTRTLDKALGLLSRLVADRGAHSITALAEEAGLAPATAHRLVATFERRGFVTRIGRGRYLPGPTLMRLAGAADLNQVLETAARPIIEALARQTGLTAHLGVFEGDMVTYLIKAGRQGDDIFTREKMQLEAYCSAIGKVLLALLPQETRERYLSGGPFIALTAHTITDPEQLRRELHAIRAQSIARDEREIDADLRCVAAPVFDDSGGAVAAISVSARGGDDPGAHETAVRAAAEAISKRLYPGRGDGD